MEIKLVIPRHEVWLKISIYSLSNTVSHLRINFHMHSNKMDCSIEANILSKNIHIFTYIHMCVDAHVCIGACKHMC